MKKFLLPVLLIILFWLPAHKSGLALQALEQTTAVSTGEAVVSSAPAITAIVTLPGVFLPTATPLMPTVLPSPTSPPATITPTATTRPLQILSPLPGQALQGAVSIVGAIPGAGFTSYEITFSYDNDVTNTWFPIHQAEQFPEGNTLAQWDTTTISDGEYTLRLVAQRSHKEPLTLTIAGLRVRNYTPIETSTPVSPTATQNPEEESLVTPAVKASPTWTATPAYTAIPITPLPTNPAQLTTQEVAGSLKNGILATAAFFLLLFLYEGVRALFK